MNNKKNRLDKNKKITVRQWLAALRSGEYRQGKNRLKTVNSRGVFYCCLGVGYQEAQGYCPQKVQFPSYNFLSDLPEEMILGDNDIYLDLDYSSASSLNDSGKFNFKQIADIISKEVRKYRKRV